MMCGLRCLIDPALDGPENMARDEALLSGVGAGESPPTLRYYRWRPPTISLGYFQKFAEVGALAGPAGALPVVRRLTGGGAILHAEELTYSAALPTGHPLVGGNPNDLYGRFHDAIIAALACLGVRANRCGKTVEPRPRLGPFFCFQRRHGFDVLVGKEKIAGSAQKRTPDAILQHGSIVLDNPFAQQRSFGGILPKEDVLSRLIAAIREGLNVPTTSGAWTEEELASARKLRAKYLDPGWTRRM